MRTLSKPFRRQFHGKKGQTLVEYALILVVLTVLALGVFSVFSERIELIFSGINAILDTAQGS
jgi:Flp pilus assembly pilin Flp